MNHFFVMMASLLFFLVAAFVCQMDAFKSFPSSLMRHPRKFALSMVFDWKSSKKNTEERMTKSTESLQSQLNTLRASGANPAMLDRIIVCCFDSMTPLNQIARVGTSGPSQLTVEPYDPNNMLEIEKAILNSDLNLTPNSDGLMIRLNLPPLTEDRRKELVKQAGAVCEAGKVSVRNVRRDCADKIKQAEKVKDISKDESKGYQDDLQKSTDSFIKKMETMLKVKETDLLKI